jgi:hypothetical protein
MIDTSDQQIDAQRALPITFWNKDELPLESPLDDSSFLRLLQMQPTLWNSLESNVFKHKPGNPELTLLFNTWKKWSVSPNSIAPDSNGNNIFAVVFSSTDFSSASAVSASLAHVHLGICVAETDDSFFTFLPSDPVSGFKAFDSYKDDTSIFFSSLKDSDGYRIPRNNDAFCSFRFITEKALIDWKFSTTDLPPDTLIVRHLPNTDPIFVNIKECFPDSHSPTPDDSQKTSSSSDIPAPPARVNVPSRPSTQDTAVDDLIADSRTSSSGKRPFEESLEQFLISSSEVLTKLAQKESRSKREKKSEEDLLSGLGIAKGMYHPENFSEIFGVPCTYEFGRLKLSSIAGEILCSNVWFSKKASQTAFLNGNFGNGPESFSLAAIVKTSSSMEFISQMNYVLSLLSRVFGLHLFLILSKWSSKLAALVSKSGPGRISIAGLIIIMDSMLNSVKSFVVSSDGEITADSVFCAWARALEFDNHEAMLDHVKDNFNCDDILINQRILKHFGKPFRGRGGRNFPPGSSQPGICHSFLREGSCSRYLAGQCSFRHETNGLSSEEIEAQTAIAWSARSRGGRGRFQRGGRGRNASDRGRGRGRGRGDTPQQPSPSDSTPQPST